MTINLSKCFFGKHEIPFLGYLVSKQGIKPTSEKVKAIIDYKKQKTIYELRKLIGIINFYRRCLKNAASHQAVLTEYLKDSRKRDRRLIIWILEADETFKNCKEEFLRVIILAHLALNVPLILTCDMHKIVADFLLRIESVSMPMIVSLEELAELQKEDKELKTLLTNPSKWARFCLPCQCAKVQNTKNLLQKIAVLDQRFQYIHLDLIGPLPICQNFCYCLTMID
ncbi:hypothetical protein ACFW04_011548 [Cataglyphis niger]